MKYLLRIYSCCLIVIAPIACTNNKTAVKEIVLQADYDKIKNIISIANCSSPFGDYTTEVHSLSDGSCYFLQKFSPTDPPFIVKLSPDNEGLLLDENDKILDTLTRTDVEMIRGHEVHKMSINPSIFFKNIQFKENKSIMGSDHEVYHGQDGLKNPVKLYYDRDQKAISKIELVNPKDSLQIIEIIYEKWEPTAYGDMVKEVQIVQAKKDTFNFKFNTIKINQ